MVGVIPYYKQIHSFQQCWIEEIFIGGKESDTKLLIGLVEATDTIPATDIT